MKTRENPSLALSGIKLSAAAKMVRDNLTDDDLAHVMRAKKAAFVAVAQSITINENRDVVAAIMALQKAKASESDHARLISMIKGAHPAYSGKFLRGSRELCHALLAAREAEKSQSVSGAIVGRDGFDTLTTWAENRLEHLNKDSPKLFRHGGGIARVVVVKEEDSATIKTLDRDGFAAAFPAKFQQASGDNATRVVAPPTDVMTNLHKRADELPLPYLAGITRTPVFGERGELHTTPGYDRESMVFYAPPVDLHIPTVGRWGSDEGARQRDLDAAKRLLVEEVLADFPFDGWSRERIMAVHNGTSGEPLPAAMMNALGAMIEPFVRAMIGQPTPALLVTKPAAGTGATYLVNAMQLIAAGRANTRSPLSGQEEERQKALSVALESAEPIILYDNQKRAVDSPTLAAALTSQTITARTLGKSEEKSIPVRSTVAFTTNNARFSEELQRRLSLIRLDTKMHDPKTRSGYRHADLHEWITANRGRLVWAILTLVANWVHGGCQAPLHVAPIPSYLGWAFVIGGILEAADGVRFTQFQANRHEIASFAAAGEEEGIEAVITAWFEANKPMTAAELAVLAEAEGIEIDGVRRAPDGAISGRSLAQHLGSFAGRRFLVGQNGGSMIEVELAQAGERRGSTVWELVQHGAAQDTHGAGPVETMGDAAGAASAAAKTARMPARYRHFPLHEPRGKVGRMSAGSTPEDSASAVVRPFRRRSRPGQRRSDSQKPANAA